MYCRSCGETLVNDATIDYVADLFEREGSDAWFSKTERELLPEGTACGKCGHAEFRKETDIMDVWFDSGSSHEAVLKQREELSWPADLYLEGSDQYRGWFNSSLSTSVAVTGKAPYRQVLSHGFILDGEGRKMSKSLGNVVVPQKIVDQMGADILRLWVASVDYQADVRISNEILKHISEVYRKIRNTLRFLLGNLQDFTPERHPLNAVRLRELDRFMLQRLQEMSQRVGKAYEAYEFHVVYQTIHNFCGLDLSSFYLDICKDALYTEAADSPVRRGIQYVLYQTLLSLVKWISPILPHTADEAWRFIPGVKEISVQLTEFDKDENEWLSAGQLERWDRFLRLRDDILKALELARKEKVIGSSLEAEVTLYCASEEVFALLGQLPELDKLLIVSAVRLVAPEKERDEAAIAFPDLHVLVRPMQGEKCERCWTYTADVGQVEAHPTLCRRCAETVAVVLGQ